MTYVLDTNSWVHHLRHGPKSNVTAKLLAAPKGSVFLSSVVLGELLYGAYHCATTQQAHNLGLIAALRQQFTSLPFDDAAAEEYGQIRAYLARLGTPIGPNDLLIASIARSNQFTVVTNDTTEFSRVPGLVVEDWQ